MDQILLVFLLWLSTALATWLGILPFYFGDKIDSKRIWYGNAIAAGLMIAVSFGMMFEGMWNDVTTILFTFFGLLLWLWFIILSEKFISDHDMWFEDIAKANAKKILLIIWVMTVHSFAEWVAIWVSFGPRTGIWFGVAMSIALMLHNIPEWLAIWLTSIPKWMSKNSAIWWAIFSSLPQPIMAVLAYIFVNQFAWFLPIWLGFAAGAMIRLAFSELLPEAMDEVPNKTVATILTISIWIMLLFTKLI